MPRRFGSMSSLAMGIVFLAVLPALAETFVDTAWVRRYNGPGNGGDEAVGIVVDGLNNVYVTGRSWSSGTDYDYATIKYYPSGDTAWVRRYDGTGNDEDDARAITVDDSGNVYVTGYADQLGSPYQNHEYATIKYYPDGDTAWVRTYNGAVSGGDRACAIAVDDYGNVYVTGESYGGATGVDYATIKYYPDGDTAWVRRYNGLANYWDEAHAIAVDGSNNVYVTGESPGSGISTEDYATIKYYPDGDTAWVRRYNGPGDSTDYAYVITVDSCGNVYVAGTCWNGTDYDYATIKYYPNGDTAWVRRYNGPGNGRDCAYAIAVDGCYNVYVTGYSLGSGTSWDYATIKYDPDGDTAWTRRYNRGADYARAIAVDGFSNVYVTGYSSGSGSEFDYATIKYYPNGDTAWVMRYNGPGDYFDWAYGIAVDGSNNVYVTGQSYGTGTSWDYATIKYVQLEPSCDSLYLHSGWQWVSTDVDPDPSEIESLFADCWGDLDIMVACDGSFCIPGVGCWIDGWNVVEMYKVHMAAICGIEFCGPRVPTDTLIPLNVGWNCIAYLPECPLEPTFALTSIWDNLDIVQNDAGEFCIPGVGCWIECMEYNEGYKMYLSSADVLAYPTDCPPCPPPFAKANSHGVFVKATHFSYSGNTGESYSLVVNWIDLDDQPPEFGDEVGVFTSSGLCVGAGVWQGDILGIATWQDDDRTELTDGFLVGEEIVFKLWDSREDEEVELSASFERGDGRFGTGAYALVSLKGVSSQVPKQFELAQNYPNPFNPETQISYGLPKDCHVRLTIYNLLGQRIKVLVDEKQPAGKKLVHWNGKDDKGKEVASGIYFFTIEADGSIQTKKMLLLR